MKYIVNKSIIVEVFEDEEAIAYFDDYVDIPYDGEEGHFITEWSNIENAIIAWANKGANVGYTSY